jgi:signal peptide peptidase SppA
MKYDHLLSFVLGHPWAVDAQMLPVIAGILARHIAGKESSAEIAAALVDRKNLPQPRTGSVAILPIYGLLAPRMNMLSEMSGGTSYDKLSGQLRGAVADKTIKTIVLDIDSPGGSIAGNTEFVAEVMRARTKKPVLAQAQYTMGSAAYRIGAAATEIIASPSATIGAIGVYNIHDDLSEALAKEGIKRSYISAGEGKVDGNPSEPLSDAARARMTARVETAYTAFITDVVKGRGKGMSADRVRHEWKSHAYGADEARGLGMIDAIATLDETILRLLSASPDASDQRAALDFTSTTTATLQEPSPATSQEPASDASWQTAIEGALLELDL